MSQVKIYGLESHLVPIREKLSAVIHDCVVEALAYPRDKRAHRFFPMQPENMLFPEGRTAAYTIIEFHMIEGRTVATRKKLIRLVFDRIEAELGIAPRDIEIAILESPACNWGFRGLHGDEVQLNYRIDV
jgi:hypothetical protein